MPWKEILTVIAAIIISAYARDLFYPYKNNRYYNNKSKKRKIK